jgi:urea transport system substrate-binding protein
MSTVLVIEDDSALRALLIILLERAGYSAKAASNGREGLERVEKGMPDLILLDMRMPVMSGSEFAAAYQERYAGERQAPIVVMTAAEHAASRAREIGAQGFLAKPFMNNELLRVIAQFLVSEHTGARV